VDVDQEPTLNVGESQITQKMTLLCFGVLGGLGGSLKPDRTQLVSRPFFYSRPLALRLPRLSSGINR
jgi:hypothetical protein